MEKLVRTFDLVKDAEAVGLNTLDWHIRHVLYRAIWEIAKPDFQDAIFYYRSPSAHILDVNVYLTESPEETEKVMTSMILFPGQYMKMEWASLYKTIESTVLASLANTDECNEKVRQ